MAVLAGRTAHRVGVEMPCSVRIRGVRILTSWHCLGLDRRRSSSACLHGRSFTVFGARAAFVQLTGAGKYFPLWFGKV